MRHRFPRSGVFLAGWAIAEHAGFPRWKASTFFFLAEDDASRVSSKSFSCLVSGEWGGDKPEVVSLKTQRMKQVSALPRLGEQTAAEEGRNILQVRCVRPKPRNHLEHARLKHKLFMLGYSTR